MEVLSDIPLKFGLKKILKHFKVNTNTQARKIIKELMGLSTNLISPKAAYKVAYVENKTNATVKVGKVQFKSKILRENLNELERVFPYIITIGEKLENKAASMKDLLKQYYLEEMGDLALHSISEYLEKYLNKKLH